MLEIVYDFTGVTKIPRGGDQTKGRMSHVEQRETPVNNLAKTYQTDLEFRIAEYMRILTKSSFEEY